MTTEKAAEQELTVAEAWDNLEATAANLEEMGQEGPAEDARNLRMFLAYTAELLGSLQDWLAHIDRYHGEGGYPGNRCEWCTAPEERSRATIRKSDRKRPVQVEATR